MAADKFCWDLLIKLVGDAVELGRDPEIKLREVFGSVDIRRGEYKGKGEGKSGGAIPKVSSGGGGEDRKVIVGDGGKVVKVELKNGKGEKAKGKKVEGGKYKGGPVEGEGGEPKFKESEADKAGRERGPHVCDVCMG